MAIKHVAGDFFDGEHGDTHKAFGFSGSMGGERSGRQRPERSGRAPEGDTFGTKRQTEPMDHFAKGGAERGGGMEIEIGVEHHPHGHQIVSEEHRADGGKVCHHSHGGMTIVHADGHTTHHHHDGSPVEHRAEGGMMHHMHPHGHDVTHVEHHADGRVQHHHSHGGHTVHHKDGRVTHHLGSGAPAHSMGGGIEGMHDSSEYAHSGKAHLARGGQAPLPRGMKPMAARHHSPIGMQRPGPDTNSPATQTPGGPMGYGVQSSTEPDPAGGGDMGGAPMMREGGSRRRRE